MFANLELDGDAKSEDEFLEDLMSESNIIIFRGCALKYV